MFGQSMNLNVSSVGRRRSLGFRLFSHKSSTISNGITISTDGTFWESHYFRKT